MTHPQKAFLDELKSKAKLSVQEYAALYNKHSRLAIEHEENNGVSQHQAKAMGNYYTVSVLSDFVGNEHTLDRIIKLAETLPQ